MRLGVCTFIVYVYALQLYVYALQLCLYHHPHKQLQNELKGNVFSSGKRSISILWAPPPPAVVHPGLGGSPVTLFLSSSLHLCIADPPPHRKTSDLWCLEGALSWNCPQIGLFQPCHDHNP